MLNELLQAAAWAFIACPFVIGLLAQCSCCSSCTIFSDDFATDRTGTDYTVSSGSWTVSGGALTTGSTGALIIENTAGTTGHGRATVRVKSGTNGATMSIRGAYVDTNNYVFCELTVNGGSSEFKLWKRVSGSNTQLGFTRSVTANAGAFYQLELCWDGTYARACFNSEAGSLLKYAYTGTGNQVALGASANGNTCTFDDLTFKKNYADDSSCPDCTTGDGCGDGLPGPTSVTMTASLVSGTCPELSSDTTTVATQTGFMSWGFVNGVTGSSDWDPAGFATMSSIELRCIGSDTLLIKLLNSVCNPATADAQISILSYDPFHALGTVSSITNIGCICNGGNSSTTITFEVTE